MDFSNFLVISGDFLCLRTALGLARQRLRSEQQAANMAIEAVSRQTGHWGPGPGPSPPVNESTQ